MIRPSPSADGVRGQAAGRDPNTPSLDPLLLRERHRSLDHGAGGSGTVLPVCRFPASIAYPSQPWQVSLLAITEAHPSVRSRIPRAAPHSRRCNCSTELGTSEADRASAIERCGTATKYSNLRDLSRPPRTFSDRVTSAVDLNGSVADSSGRRGRARTVPDRAGNHGERRGPHRRPVRPRSCSAAVQPGSHP